MTIESIKLKNFQAHETLVLKLDRGITTIIGPSDTGKSAIIRALRWVFFNKPDGTSFITNGASFARVEVEVDGHTIRRTKGKANKYTLDGKDLFAMGRGTVPDLVQQVLNVSPDSFQCQHDAPYWFSLGPGEVSKQLNKIVDLSIIDSALSTAASNARRSKTEAELCLRHMEQSGEELVSLAYVPKLVKEFNELKLIDQQATQSKEESRSLRVLVQELRKYEEGKEQARTLAQTAKNVLLQRKQYTDVLEQLEDLTELLQDVRDLSAVQPPPDFDAPDALLHEYKAVTEKAHSLRVLVSSISELEGVLCQLEKQKSKYDRIRCPTCGAISLPKGK